MVLPDSYVFPKFYEEKRRLRRAILNKRSKAIPPIWANTLMLAEKWGTPPWEVEERLDQEWLERASAYYDIISELHKPKKGASNPGGMGLGGKTGLEGMKPGGGPSVQAELDPEAGGTIIWPD